ncbi:hypothetical protein CLIM01_13689 [Colletotrichum limetticola]|uniref:C2H2-type domain-containing protein n=1 Tax=Colletotrichum limetticola TaxID=1209924 RepID=A0ABQ9PDN8_9PEZI|nr:hypothetical protein CLIM01_13689 [Colletotrichum limetticola]
MHIAQCCDDDDDNDDDAISNKGSGGDCSDRAHQGPLAQPSTLHCPFDGCERNEPYTTRGNLVRHFQKHVPCNEICPFCGEVFKQVHRYMRHDCKSNEDGSKRLFVQQRITQFNKDVSRELDALQSHGKKRLRAIPDSNSEQAATAEGFSEPIAEFDAPGGAPYQLGSAKAIDGEPKTKAQKLEAPARSLDESMAIMGAKRECDLQFTAEEVDGEWAFASTGTLACASNDIWGGLDQSALGYGEWAFANPGVNSTINNADWSFDQNFAKLASGGSKWGLPDSS